MKKLFLILPLAMCLSQGHAMNLSLDGAVDRIIAESNDIKKADANVQKARAGLSAVNASRWPSISGTAAYVNIINVEAPGKPMEIIVPEMPMLGIPASVVPYPQHIGTLGASATMPIYTFGKIGHAADAARGAIKMAQSGNALARAEVRAAAAQIYWTAKMTDEMVVIAEKNLKASTSAKRQLERAGRANKANLVKISADIAAKEIALSDAEFNRDSAHRLLKIMAGIDDNEKLTLIDKFPNSYPSLDAPETLVSNHEWDMLSENAQMYESQSKSRRAARLPTLAAMAQYDFTATHIEQQVWDGNKEQAANWGLALTMPIFDGGLSRANATMDAMAAESARQDLDKSKKLKSNEYRDAILKHEHLRGNLSKLKEAHDLADRAAKISMDRFTAGQTSAVELSDVQASLAQMDLGVLNAKFNILMAEESIKKLNGK